MQSTFDAQLRTALVVMDVVIVIVETLTLTQWKSVVNDPVPPFPGSVLHTDMCAHNSSLTWAASNLIVNSSLKLHAFCMQFSDK